MKKMLLGMLAFASANFSDAQTKWLRCGTGMFNEWGHAVASDAAGNVYTIGEFVSNSLTFGAITITNTQASTTDIFVVKYDSLGNVLWAKNIGGANDERGTGIACDVFGNVYIIGYFYSPSIILGTDTVLRTGSISVLIAKLDGAGNPLWAVSAVNTTNASQGRCITTDLSGNIYIGGIYTADSVTFGSTTLTNSGYMDLFIAKYDSSGNALWAHSAIGSSWDYAYGITTDINGNIFLTGEYGANSITFGSFTLTNTPFFLVKYNSSGNVLWAKGGSGAVGFAVAADGNGNVCVTGFFYTTATFDTTNLSGGDEEPFLVKYDASGNLLWARGGGGTEIEDDRGQGISIDGSDNIYMFGNFESNTITFGTTTLVNSITSGPYGDYFLVKYDPSGNVVWAQSAQTASSIHDRVGMVAKNGYLYVGAHYAGTLLFPPWGCMASSGDDVFTAKICPIITPVITASGSVSLCQGDSVTLTSSAGYNYLWSTGATTQSVTVTTAGTYRVTVSEPNGCSLSSSTVNVTVHANPPIPTITVSANGDTLTSSSVSGNQWNLNGVSIPGATNQTYVITQPGLYTVTVTNIYGCSSTSSFITGIQIPEAIAISSVLFSPNPVTNEITIQSSKFNVEKVEVFDVFGKRLTLNLSLKGEGLRADVSALSPGIYFVKVRGEKGESVVKFMKQ